MHAFLLKEDANEREIKLKFDYANILITTFFFNAMLNVILNFLTLTSLF